MVLDLENVVGLLIAAEMYELVALREICKSFVLYHAHEVFRNPQIVQLPEKLLLEVMQQLLGRFHAYTLAHTVLYDALRLVSL